MGTKEEAKAYDEALERAQKATRAASDVVLDVVRYIFPELEENEDERIRKELLSFIESVQHSYLCATDRRKKWIAYLEKQKEQKPEVDESTKRLNENWMKQYFDEQKPAEIDEEHKVGKWFTGLIPCWIDAPSTLQPAHRYHGKNVIAIHLKDGGYRCCCVDDKKPITFCVAEDTHLVEGWKDRKPVEWSEEDERMLSRCIKSIETSKQFTYSDIFNKAKDKEIAWLKAFPFNLKKKNEDVVKLCSNEWSEEDEEMLWRFTAYIPNEELKRYGITRTDILRRIKSLRPSWKPSEEQINALYNVIYSCDDASKFDLESLYNDLKKFVENGQ